MTAISSLPYVRNIKVGCNYRMHASYGYAGIIEGNVKVLSLELPAMNEDILARVNDFVAYSESTCDEAMQELEQLHDTF